MKNLIAILISATFVLTACRDSRKLTPAPETIFDDNGLQVITSFHNDRTHTISVLYGNDAALTHASNDHEVGKLGAATPDVATPDVAAPGAATPGAMFKLVTWDLKQNPLWFGSNINGSLQTVETVTVSSGESGPAVSYTREDLNPVKGRNAVLSNAERISFIFAQRASVFP